ncbi:hypothetical protein ACE4RR_08685 [Alteribacillus sp. HJP-4]
MTENLASFSADNGTHVRQRLKTVLFGGNSGTSVRRTGGGFQQTLLLEALCYNQHVRVLFSETYL